MRGLLKRQPTVVSQISGGRLVGTRSGLAMAQGARLMHSTPLPM